MAATATLSVEEVPQGESLALHKDHISANELDLKDPYVSASLGLFVIHNVIRRNLAACARNAKTVKPSDLTPFVFYATYTLYVLEDQLESVDTIWFPKFAEYDERFKEQVAAHAPLRESVSALQAMLKSTTLQDNVGTQVSDAFEQLGQKVEAQFDTEENLVNELGRRVPINEIRPLEKQQEARRMSQAKTYGQLWTAVYLLRGLDPKERAIFPPGIPKLVVSGMLTAGALQFRK
ncbi:hypothetical protein H2201_007076 [Coniosporium apollinis]|uniref:Heme haloperoxidase family profile domain-containing protein n=1 Tax=Coniosporium apollinis TaxID=61459 RepID=A0ABQ9NMH4_9PEZI|nr:hypothetical protein H2201_007076 [Coniosporium apollinis]